MSRTLTAVSTTGYRSVLRRTSAAGRDDGAVHVPRPVTFALCLVLAGVLSAAAPAWAAPAPATAPAQALDAEAIADLVEPAVVEVDASLAFDRGDATGTGMILTASGEVLTNNHVIQSSTDVTVTVTVDGRTRDYNAEVVGTAPSEDVALLQLEGASDLPTVIVGDSSALTVGDRVIAIGTALDTRSPLRVTEGSVSGLERTVTVADGRGATERLTGLIQTSAELAPGNSGGPLVDEAGEVVGMNTAAEVGRFGDPPSSTTGFAIPIEAAVEIVDQIEAGDEEDGVIIGPTAYLGVSARDARETGTDGGLPAERAPTLEGALLIGIQPGGPAEAAGLVVGDVIIAFAKLPIGDSSELVDAVRARDPGEKIRVTWLDAGGTRHRERVTLTEGPAA